jgi:hypothetical protein
MSRSGKEGRGNVIGWVVVRNPSTAAALRDLCSIPAGQGCVPAEVITS